MNVSQHLTQSNYLTRGDVRGKDLGNGQFTGVLVTIRDCIEENVAKQGAEKSMKWILYFEECEKGIVLNKTNGKAIANITGSEDSEHWTGHQVVLYDNPSVEFAGEIVGGIRVRAPRRAPVQPPQRQVAPQPPQRRAPEQSHAQTDGRNMEQAPQHDGDQPF